MRVAYRVGYSPLSSIITLGSKLEHWAGSDLLIINVITVRPTGWDYMQLLDQ